MYFMYTSTSRWIEDRARLRPDLDREVGYFEAAARRRADAQERDRRAGGDAEAEIDPTANQAGYDDGSHSNYDLLPEG